MDKPFRRSTERAWQEWDKAKTYEEAIEGEKINSDLKELVTEICS